MGVYIKGWDQPKDCNKCPFWQFDAEECKFCGITPDCPLIEVPDHGNLIDAHSLKIRLGQRFCLDERKIMEIVRETVDTAKVIIPAERRKYDAKM